MRAAHGDSEPMARKIELADEFRRIGDHEGARELLEEVVVQGRGPAEGPRPDDAGRLGLTFAG